MPELALHFAVPFALSAPIIGLRKAAIVSFVALLPDLDFVFQVHRSVSHSLVVLFVGSLLLITCVKRFRPQYFSCTFITCLALFSHLLMDMFSGATPALWPLVERPFSVDVELAFVVGGSWRFDWTVLMTWSQPPANPFPVADVAMVGPIVTSEGFIVSLMLVAIPIMMRLLRQRPFRSRG